MKNLILFSIIIFAFHVSIAQTETVISSNEGPEVFTIVETMPSWQGCEKFKTEEKRDKCTIEKFMKFLSKNMVYPPVAFENNITGTVKVVFILNELGEITDPKIVSSLSTELDNEAIRVVSQMPKWNPGTQKGVPVRVQYNIPINFTLR